MDADFHPYCTLMELSVGKRARRPRKVSPTLISYTAQRYLSRYMATEARLRQVLNRKISKRLWEREQQLSLAPEAIEAERDAAATLIDAEVQKLIASGQVDDRRSATTWTRNYSIRKIRAADSSCWSAKVSRSSSRLGWLRCLRPIRRRGVDVGVDPCASSTLWPYRRSATDRGRKPPRFQRQLSP